jgi:4-amino-4-deoxy-L-arabinose transferase-like glycosyltransferase
MLTIFTAWALPYFLEVRSHSSLETWSHEVAVAYRGEEGRSEDWWLNLPSGIAYFLPWIFLLLFIRLNKIVDPAQREVARGLTWGTFVPFVAVLLFPGALPRYVLPLGAPISWLIGMAYAHGAFEWRLAIRNFQIRVPRQLIGSLIAIGIVGEIVIFPLRTMTFLKRHERVKPIAEQINAVALPGEPLYAIGQVSQPYFFYVRAPVIYVSTLDDLPATARNFFIQSRDLEKLEANPQWNVLRPQLVARIPRYRNREAMIFAVKPKKD